ncbi:tail assembly chaperone [Lachnospiraceae bacterium LCP19S3_B12]|nr:hypothetical protein DXA96_13870 [Lachnospiraceae bacterium OF09-33XD]
MQISVNGKNIELNFGIRFVRELDKKFHLTLEGGKRIGTGLEETVPLLFTGDILALEDIIQAAAWGADGTLTQEEMDDYLDSVEDIDTLFETVLKELKNQNATRRKTLALVADLEERAKAQSALKKTKKILRNDTKS